jgi:hypothetical protein
MFCQTKTEAAKRYQRRVLYTMSTYLVLLFGAVLIVKHLKPHGWLLYFWALLPAVPVIALIFVMWRYLQEETDEYMRSLTIQSMLVGTGALVATLVVNDFLRSFAEGGALPPFVGYMVFFVGFGLAQWVQMLRNRVSADE